MRVMNRMVAEKEIKVRTTHGFIYPDINIPGYNIDPMLITKALAFSSSMYTARYLSKTVIEECDDDIFINPEKYVNNFNWITKFPKIKQNIKSMKSILSSRLEGVDYNAQLFMMDNENITAPTKFTSTDAHILILVISYSKQKFVSVTPLTLIYQKNGDSVIKNGIRTIFYYEDKFKAAHHCIEDEKVICTNGALTSLQVTLVNKLIDLLANDQEDRVIPNYSKVESKLVEAMAQSIHIKQASIPIGSFKTQYNIDHNCDELFNQWDREYPNEISRNADWNEYPLMDLSEKEMRFIDKYCDKMGYLDEEGQTPIDLFSLLSSIKFGNHIRSKATIISEGDEVDDKAELLTFFESDKTNNIIRFYSASKASNDSTVLIEVDIVNADHYSLNESLYAVHIELVMNSFNHAPMNADQLYAISPIVGINPTDIITAMHTFLKICLTMRDRPERTKIVKCTEKRYVATGKKNKKEEREFVISRILKSTSDAREYVKKMGSAGDRHCEYVIEEWSRREHTRTLKSGKVIHINETMCHRHKDLTDKEIHIKL